MPTLIDPEAFGFQTVKHRFCVNLENVKSISRSKKKEEVYYIIFGFVDGSTGGWDFANIEDRDTAYHSLIAFANKK